MSTIKSYSDLQQSKKLAEILPLESADMYWFEGEPFVEAVTGYEEERAESHRQAGMEMYPCWSLAALLKQIPYVVCDDDGNPACLQINKKDDVYQLEYKDYYRDFESIETNRHEHFVDACYEMIIRLNELKLL